MVEAGPKPITRAHLSRRAALKRAAGAVAGAAAAPVVAGTSAHPDALLLDLERMLRIANAEWQHALERFAEAERRVLAMQPTPPPAIVIPDADGSNESVVPESWSALRRHLRRAHGGDPALETRLAAARKEWAAYNAACERLANPDWLIAAAAAEAKAAAAVEALHARIAQAPTRSAAGLRLKLQVLWDRTGRRPGDSEHDVSEQLLWSALQDARRAAKGA